MTKIKIPNAFPVSNPLTILIALTDMTTIQTINAIAKTASKIAQTSIGPITDKTCSSFVLGGMRYDGFTSASEPHIRNTSTESIIIMGIAGTYVWKKMENTFFQLVLPPSFFPIK